MEFQSSLDQLEAAARVLLAPPYLVNKDERTSGEQMFLEFRKTRNAFALCKYIIEHSQTDFLVFETADVLRNNLIQDWAKVPPDDIQVLNNNILAVLMNSSSQLSYSARRRLASVVALIVKHQSFIQNGKQRSDLVTHLINSVVNHVSPLISVCCVFDAITAEHQYIVNVTDASLTYEMHFAAKKDFENSDLLRIFQFCLRWLSSYSHDPSNLEKKRELDHILKLIENIMYWSFTKNLPRRVAGVVEMEATPAFKPPLSWSETIANAAFIPVFFDIHIKLRADENFILRTVNMILQLVTLHGPLVNTKDTRVEFLSRLIPPFTELLKIHSKLPIETLGLSDIMRKIMLFHRTGTLLGLTPVMFNDFVKEAGNFTCFVIEMSIIEESKTYVDDRVYRESLTRVLEAWMNLLTDTDASGPKEVMRPVATNIFNAYLQAHLSPPEGFRQSAEVINEDIDEEDETDSVQFRDQLQAMGVFGRFILPHSVPILANLLTYKCQAFQTQVEAVASQKAGRESLDLLNEDLHWTLLIAGHVLAFDGLGETNLIPPEIIEVSLQHNGTADHSAGAIQNAFQLLPFPEGNEIDPIVGLVCRVICLSEMERRVMESNLGQLLSPEVASNVLWFLHRWAQSYFNMNEEYYASVSPAFVSAWGVSSVTSSIAQTALFRRIREDLVRFSGESDVIKEAINLLLALVDSNKKAETAIQSPELQPLLHLTNQVGPGKYQMPNEQYRKFIRAMVTVGSYCEETTQRSQYWDQIVGPLNQRLKTIIGLNPVDRHRDEVRQELAYVLSGLIGTAMSSNSKIASYLYLSIVSVVKECGGILDAYHNYEEIVELCLEFITEVGKRSLSYLSHADSITLYEGAMSVVKSYALHASGRRNFEKTAEEDAYNDLVLLLDMLSCLLTKDFLDLSPEAVNEGLSPPISAAEVSLQGLSIVMPFMNAELLRYPNLSTKYFRLVAFVTELHAEKVMNLPMPMIQALFESVQLGLQTTTTEAFTSCCEFILAISNFISLNNHQNSIPGGICRNFLKYFLEMILSDKVNKDSIPSVSSALFALISAFTESYHELAHQLILSRPSGETQQSLSDAFEKLTSNLNLTAGGDRVSRAHFRDRLENFIFVVRGCLD